MSTEESNRLLSKFMGLDKYGLRDSINTNVDWDCVEYHSSWDWLMPVVEKIESIHDEKHGYFGVYISSNSCVIQGTNFRSDMTSDVYFAQYEGVTKIAATHHAVTNFIQWYNKHLK